jgi:hypothetical protein
VVRADANLPVVSLPRGFGVRSFPSSEKRILPLFSNAPLNAASKSIATAELLNDFVF